MHYFGGLAEFVSRPSGLTYSYLSRWITGSASFGRAMDLLGLPYSKNTRPILIMIDGELAVDLFAESSVLYDRTLFSYRLAENPHDTPALRLTPGRLLSPICITNTLRTIFVQSNWIANPSVYLKTFTAWVDDMTESYDQLSPDQLSDLIEKQLLPYTLAIGFVSEFFSQYLSRDSGPEIHETISALAKNDDWLFRSISDMELVQNGSMPFEKYIEAYGIRADDDYELTCPRWNEIPSEIQKRITSYSPPANKITVKPVRQTPLINSAVSFTMLRSQAKRKMLIAIHALRKSLIAEKKIDTSSEHTSQTSVFRTGGTGVTSGTGRPVSSGEVTGTTFRIRSTADKIPKKAIGIFPDASPVYSILYTKCIGLIFLRGGTTSHGAIVAREYGIPALIDPEAANIPDNTNVKVNGGTGTWSIQS